MSLVEDSAVDDVGFDTGDRDGVSLACFVNDLVSVTRCGRRREDYLTANVGKVRETVAVSWGIFGDHPHVLLDRTVVCFEQDYSFAGLVSIIEHLLWAQLQVGAITGGRNYVWAQLRVGAITGGRNYVWAQLRVGALTDDIHVRIDTHTRV